MQKLERLHNLQLTYQSYALGGFEDLLDVHKKCPTLSLSPSPVAAEHSCLFRPRKVHSTLSLCLHPACAQLVVFTPWVLRF